MAQKRLIDKKISLSEKLAELPFGAQLLYTWMIPHADDFGLLQGSPRTIKAQIIPMADASVKDVTEWIDAMLSKKLIKQFEFNGKNFYYIIGFEENQTLRHDMQPYTVLPVELGKKYDDNWKKIEAILAKCLKRNTSVTTSSEIVTEEKEDKISKVREEKEDKKVSKACLSSLTPCDEYCVWDIGMELHTHKNNVIDKREDLIRYVKKHPDKYTSFHETLLDWVRLDLKKGYLQQMTEIEELDMPLEHPDYIKRRNEAARINVEKGVL